MDLKEYEVEVVYSHRAIYRVSAADRERAEQLAAERWKQGDPSDVPGFDWAALEDVRAAEAPDTARRAEDAELVLRFLRERERLILRLGGALFGSSNNDAISASQVASDLGWSRPAGDGTNIPDVGRATRALEHLCRTQRVVCFQKPRVRSGERGEIRLYCTPEYLEGLTASLNGLSRQAG